jgi:hypothetical protein
MSRPTRQNEAGEHPENPVEREIPTLPKEIDQNDRNGVVGEPDQSVGVPKLTGYNTSSQSKALDRLPLLRIRDRVNQGAVA